MGKLGGETEQREQWAFRDKASIDPFTRLKTPGYIHVSIYLYLIVFEVVRRTLSTPIQYTARS